MTFLECYVNLAFAGAYMVQILHLIRDQQPNWQRFKRLLMKFDHVDAKKSTLENVEKIGHFWGFTHNFQIKNRKNNIECGQYDRTIRDLAKSFFNYRYFIIFSLI